MTTLRRLAVITTAVTYVLVAVGGLVRATESGLGCPDWPRCHGALVPPDNFHARVEYSHRLVASVVILLTIALAAVAWSRRRRGGLGRKVFRLAVITVPLVFSQALLGALVVALELDAESVVAHLLVAMTLVAILVCLLIETSPGIPAPGAVPIDRRFARLATAVAGAALVLMLVGSYMSGRGAGLAFTGWPLFDGRIIPDRHGVLPDLHFTHRVLAAIVAAGVFGLVRLARSRGQAPAVLRLLHGAAALIVIEILVGAGNIWTRLSSGTRTAHLALGALIFGALFAASRLAGRLPQESATLRAPPPDSEPLRAPVSVGSAP